MKKRLCHALKQDRQSRRAAWIQAAGPDKGLNIDRHQAGRQKHGHKTPKFLLFLHVFPFQQLTVCHVVLTELPCTASRAAPRGTFL